MQRIVGAAIVAFALLALAVTSVARASDTEAAASPYIAGNTAAARGDHAAAAAAFEESIAQDGWSVGALLGLGNAYANQGDHGRAILALERARLLAPADAAVATNLTRQREQAALTSPAPTRLDVVLAQRTSDDWAWLAFATAALACAGVVTLAWSSRRRLGAGLAVAGIALTIGAGAAALRMAPDPGRAIVLVEESARIAPIPAAESAFVARPGENVRIEMQRGDQVYVRASDNRSGWLPQSAVETVVLRDRRSSRS